MEWKIFRGKKQIIELNIRNYLNAPINTSQLSITFNSDVFLFHISSIILREIIRKGSNEEFILKIF